MNVRGGSTIFCAPKVPKNYTQMHALKIILCIWHTYSLSLSLSLSLSWSVLDSSYMDTCVENYLMYLTYSLSLSLMECAQLIMYGCMHWELSYISAILSLSHTTYGYISITHIWNNYCALESVVVKTSSVISQVPTQLGGGLVNFYNNK